MSAAIGHEYHRLRSMGWTAAHAYTAAKARVAFEALEGDGDEGGLVRMRVEPDETYDATDWLDEPETMARLERDGAWGIIGEARSSESAPWVHVDSVWGFIGDDFKDSLYDTDIMRACVAYATARPCSALSPACEGTP